MSESVKKTYRKNWDEVKNLRFLVDFLEEMDMSVADAASKLGLARQSVYYWLTKDDARLSQVIELISECGYSITFDMVKQQKGNSLVTINVPHKQGPKRLSFLSDSLRRYHISREMVSSQLELGASTVYYWFRVDDCFVSYIFRIAQMNGLKIRIDINPTV